MRAAKEGFRYSGGTYKEGKKIVWKDGLSASVAILCARVFLFSPIPEFACTIYS
jgi:hypothetical protein